MYVFWSFWKVSFRFIQTWQKNSHELYNVLWILEISWKNHKKEYIILILCLRVKYFYTCNNNIFWKRIYTQNFWVFLKPFFYRQILTWNATPTFYLMDHSFISFLNHDSDFKKVICSQLFYTFFSQIYEKVWWIGFDKR